MLSIRILLFNNRDYKKAIFWYKLATELEKPVDCWGFISDDAWGYTPSIQLCVCYDKIGDIENAIKYNNKAAKYKENDPSVIIIRNTLKV